MGDMHTSVHVCLHCHCTPWAYKSTGNTVTNQMYLKVWHEDKNMGVSIGKGGGGGGGGGVRKKVLTSIFR